jgi:ketosteroid isomerase-like protein
MLSTADVHDQHLRCFGENDLEGVLADYSSDAVLFVPGEPLKGPDAIKPFFQAFFSEFAKPSASLSMRQLTRIEALLLGGKSHRRRKD